LERSIKVGWDSKYVIREDGIDAQTRDVTNTERIRLEHGTDTGKVSGKETNAKREWNQSSLSAKTNGNGHKPNWDNFPTVSPICSRNDGVSSDTYRRTFQNENSMDRSLVIKSALDEGRIKVDFNTGKIYSTRQRGKYGQEIELNGADCNGYIVHNITYDGIKKQCRAHQIVWIAANGLYDKDYLMIDHINRDRKDNRLINLRLVTAKDNRDNSTPYNGKLSEEERQRLLQLYLQGNNSMRELADDFGISKSRVHQIITEEKDRLDSITFSKWRNESIKAAGNAVVPQVVLQLFKAIEKFELNKN
jgi:transposase-like protein